MKKDLAIRISNLKKQYRLGTLGGGTLTADVQSWWAQKRGKEDPNTKIGLDRKRIGTYFWALDGIDVEVHKGEALGIIGTNGAGKSTLLKILSRVTAPTEGDVWINGKIASMLEVGTGFHPELTGRENIYMNGAILGMSRKEVEKKIENIIEFSECREFIDTPVKRYSSGMYVKLGFAVAAHLDADILVMDEVLAVGDARFQEKCLGKMDDAAGREGKTVLYVSHNMNTIRSLCTRCIVLKNGKLIFDGDVEKAIEVYMDRESIENKVFYDLSDCPRPSLEYGRIVYMESLEFLNKREAVFEQNEEVFFRINYRSKNELKRLQLLVTFKASNGNIVGMSQSEAFNAKIGLNEIMCQFDMKYLIPGKYECVVDIVMINEFGAYVPYDQAMERFGIVINKDKKYKGIEWEPRYWGYVDMMPIKVVGG